MAAKTRVPLAKFVEALMDDNQSTPDMVELQSEKLFVPLFSYGNERAQFSEHFRLRDKCSAFIGTGWTADPGFIMMKDPRWHCPVILNQPHAPTAVSIYGDLHLVPPEVIFDLDSHYERGVFTKRFRREIVYSVPSAADPRNRPHYRVMAFIYTGIFNMFTDAIKKGEFELVKPYKNPYSEMQTCMWTTMDDKPNRERLARLREESARRKL